MTDTRTLAELIADCAKAQRKLAAAALARGDHAEAEKWSGMAATYVAKVEEMGQAHLLGDDDK